MAEKGFEEFKQGDKTLGKNVVGQDSPIRNELNNMSAAESRDRFNAMTDRGPVAGLTNLSIDFGNGPGAQANDTAGRGLESPGKLIGGSEKGKGKGVEPTPGSDAPGTVKPQQPVGSDSTGPKDPGVNPTDGVKQAPERSPSGDSQSPVPGNKFIPTPDNDLLLRGAVEFKDGLKTTDRELSADERKEVDKITGDFGNRFARGISDNDTAKELPAVVEKLRQFGMGAHSIAKELNRGFEASGMRSIHGAFSNFEDNRVELRRLRDVR